MNNKEILTFNEDGNKIWGYFKQLSNQLDDEAHIFPKVAVPVLSPNTSSDWLNLLNHCRKAFEFHEDVVEWLKDLEDLRDYGINLGMSMLEGPVLCALANGWLGRIESQPVANVSIELVPELAADKEAITNTTQFVVVVTNNGTTETGMIPIRLTADNNLLMTHKINSLMPKATGVTELFRVSNDCQHVDLTAEYKNPSEKLTVTRVRFHQLDLTSLSESNLNSSNPYIADRPLYKGEPYVGRDTIVRNIEGHVNGSKGGIISLWGLRRVGKTSLLYRLLDKARDGEMACIPVYINCIIFEREKPWSHEEFLGEVGRAIQLRLCEEEGLRSTSPTIGQGPITINQFVDYIKQVSPNLQNRKLLLMFDDADVFGEDTLSEVSGLLFDGADFDKKIHETFKSLAYGPNPGEMGFFVLFATGTALGKLWSNIECSVQMDERLRFLGLKEMIKLVRLENTFPFDYHPLALKYLWRITGGYPALVQLVCSAVIQEWNTEKQRGRTIPLTMVRSAVRDLIRNADMEGYFKYLYRYSVPFEAHKTFQEMVRTPDVIDNRTLRIDVDKCGPGSYALDTLTTNEILSTREEERFLRVGFFKFLVEKYRMDEAYE